MGKDLNRYFSEHDTQNGQAHENMLNIISQGNAN